MNNKEKFKIPEEALKKIKTQGGLSILEKS